MLESLLQTQDKTGFFEEHFLRLPYSEPGGCAGILDVGGWEFIEQLLEADDADVMVVKAGQRWEESRTPSFSEAKELFGMGYTLLVRHAERHHPKIAALAESFEKDFQSPVDVHLYATPGGEFGFGWHYDVEDVFILQLEGEKEYSLRKNTVNPWPVLENMPADLRYERELMPMMKCRLAAGDWLYIPHGYWHQGDAEKDAISLAVGVMSPTALDVLDYARARLVHNIRYRQRLPIFTEESLTEYLSELGEDFVKLLADPKFAEQFFESRSSASDHE